MSCGSSHRQPRIWAQGRLIPYRVVAFTPNSRSTGISMVKERIQEVVRAQPEESTYDDILRELAFERMVERVLDDARNRRTVSNEEMLHRIRTRSS
jgi:hypothetical protein